MNKRYKSKHPSLAVLNVEIITLSETEFIINDTYRIDTEDMTIKLLTEEDYLYEQQ